MRIRQVIRCTDAVKRLVASLVLLLVASSLAVTSLAAQGTSSVTGTVTSSEDGRPITGVNVIVKGTNVGTITSENGRFFIAAGPTDTLVFRFIGYAPAEIAVGGRAVVNVPLRPQAFALSTIVVTGYGTQQRRDVTGAIATVSGEKVTEIATPSVAQALQGRVAGVQVTPQSGEPGVGAVVRIRGVGTLNNASPLYVVDGMLIDDIDFLNPNDIQSIEVLKDASATAIYGSRGANGVIIVSTKKGVLEGDTRFTLNSYAGTQKVLNRISLVNAVQYATLANELAANLGQAPYFANPSAVGAGTDWQDQIFQSAPIQSYQLASSGGSDRITYYFSGNYFRQEGVVPKSDFNRLTLRLNNDYTLTNRLKVGHNLNFAYTNGLRPPGVLGQLYRADPTIAPLNPDGTFANANLRSSAGNPDATVFYTHNKEKGRRLVGNVFGDLNFLEPFTFRSSFGLDYNQNEFRDFVPVFLVSPTQQNAESDLRVEFGNTYSWLWENTVNGNWATDRQRINILAGITTQAFYYEQIGGTRVNIVGSDPSLWYLDAGASTGATNYNPANDWKMLSYLFRTNYSLLNRYLLTASFRADGSSRFGPDNRYGYFPSIALGWNIADESFFPKVSAINQVKLRASWGRTGNDKIGSYPGVPIVTSNLNAVFGPSEQLTFGASPIELANPQVKWETTRQTNFGADMSFLDSRLNITIDHYNRLTDGILVRVPIADYVGVGTFPFVNAAKVENKGLEGSFTWADTREDFHYELNVNGATIKNTVKALGGGNEQILGGGLGNEITFSTRTVVGQPIGSFWGFRVAGVFQDAADVAASPKRGGEVPGDLKYADINGRDLAGKLTGVPDGKITDDDKTFIGSPIPDLIYGLGGRIEWHGLDFAANFSGQRGNQVFNGKKAVRFGVENFESSYLARWTGAGTRNTAPRVTNAGHNYQASTRVIENGGFFKGNAVQLGYRLPAGVAGRLTAKSARIYLNATNLFNHSDYSGYTSELTVEDVIRSGIDLGVFPPARTITFGLDVSF
jgi:TonB-linked SusC/RagA family outer membrane protein